ncbi:unnamed protein product, partial [Rotaria magnacalcarata]
EDVIVDDENNEPNIIMELSFNNKEKMNDSGNLYISFAFLLVFSINTTCLLNLGSTFLRNISHVNSAEAFRTSNVNQSTSDLVVEEEKIHELLDKAISSTRIEVDKNVQKKNKIGNQSQRNSNDCGASKKHCSYMYIFSIFILVHSSSFAQPVRQQFTPHAMCTTSLNSSCIPKSPTVRVFDNQTTIDVMGIIKKLFETFVGRESLSKSCILAGHVFDADGEAELFFDLVLARFENFDQENNAVGNKSFLSYVDFIIQCTMTSLTNPELFQKFSNRIDSYLYIYRRIEEYLVIVKRSAYWTWALENNVKQLKEKILESLSQVFIENKGLQPNLRLKDEQQLRRINIVQYLIAMTDIGTKAIDSFFVLIKLSLQSSIVIDEHNRLQWKTIISNINHFGITIQEFISNYIAYELAFREFPLDLPGFIELIRKNHPSKHSKESPFLIFLRLSKDLNFKTEEFFDQYRTLFERGIKEKFYCFSHIGDLFTIIGRHDRVFDVYFTIYANSVDLDDLWTMFMYLSTKSELNDIIQKHLISKLSIRTAGAPIDSFLRYTKFATECMTKIKHEYHPRFLRIFENIFEGFINHQLTDERYSYRFSESNFKEFLKISLEMSTSHDLQQLSCLLIIRRLIFQNDNRLLKIADKTKGLFNKINDFDPDLCENNDPADIIQDEWLQDYLLVIPEDFLRYFNENVYNYLCNNHLNNRWTLYIWRRLIYLSILKSKAENTNEILLKMNEWMHMVKHDSYNINDTLTIILIINLFELVIVKCIKSVLSLPKINIIMDFLFNTRKEQLHLMDNKQVDEFIQDAEKLIQQILLLQGSCEKYRDPSNSTILYCFMQSMDFKTIITSIDLNQYKFPRPTEQIELIVSPIPKDIHITDVNIKEQYFQLFIQQANEWLRWFDKFLLVFLHVVEWLKNWNVIGAAQLFNDMRTARSNSSITMIQMKTTVEKALKLLRPFNDLQRLCHLLNCLTSFQLIDSGTQGNQIISENYIRELKRLQPNNSFKVDSKMIFEYIIPINGRQNVQWCIASEKLACNIEITYQTADFNDPLELLYRKEKVPIDKYVLQGEYETQRAGQLMILIDNETFSAPRTIWYRVIQTPLSTSHLFHGIFNMFYQQYSKQSIKPIKESELSNLLDRVFTFIDNLLHGTVSLKDMADLKAVFCDKNIHVKEEVKKLFSKRSSEEGTKRKRSTIVIRTTIDPTEKEIEQVCEWLQIYQYYSHVNIIINCIETFDILPIDNDDELIGRLKRLRDENCSLKEITQTYEIVKRQFQNLSSQHLQLIKTSLECSNTVQMMKKSDLYSPHGRRRFQELRDNLTTQFQFQERNNMILNSWIITYALCEPFVLKANNFDEFLNRIAGLSKFEENSLNHIQIVNENVQIVYMWLSAEETTVLDNALLTMEHLYKTGKVQIRLRHLMNEQSYFEIIYSIDKLETEQVRRADSQDDGYEQYNDEEHNQQKSKTLKFTLTMSDIDDHKRQLTFCNVNLQENMIYRKILLQEQLKLLKIVEKIYSILVKLELTGHPDYQLREEGYEIHDRTGEIDTILTDLRKDHRLREDRLKRVVKTRTENLELIYRALKTAYDIWITNLERFRQDSRLLNLFSNRQIMILIILLTTSTTQNQIKCHFLEKLSLSKDIINHKGKEQNLTIQCLMHYLRSLKIRDCELSEVHVSRLHETYKIASNSNVETSLKKLSEFLRDLLKNGRELFRKNPSINENQQYLVTPNAMRHTTDKIPLEHDLDMETCCVLLSLFNDRLPSVYQILWCSIATEDDIHLFFLRVRTFHCMIFAVMEIDKMHHRLRELLLNEQDTLTRQEQPHGPVYYFSRELTTNRRGLRPFHILLKHRDPNQIYTQIVRLFGEHNCAQPQIQIIYGKAGIGKTHRIYTKYKDQDTSCFSINDTLNLPSLISSFLLFDSRDRNENPSVSFNISIHAPFEDLNRTFLSLFVCGSLTDASTGLTFSLPENKQWKFVIEIPHTDKYHMTIKENFDKILPLLSIISPYTLEEVTDENYQLFINREEELVARFLKAYENRTIDRLMTISSTGKDQPVNFEKLTNHDECREQIYNCMTKYAREIPRNKISELSFTKFLYRRIRFFKGHYYRLNMTSQHLGSTVMKQMIKEAKFLAHIDFRHNNYPRIYLVFDPYFALHLLHDDWNNVSKDLKQLFNNKNPSLANDFKDKDYFAKCLSWLVDIKYDDFIRIMNEIKFILTENFAYKLFHVHERKLTRLPLIIEGDTGVGKTFLLKFYSLLLNSNIINGPIHVNIDSIDDHAVSDDENSDSTDDNDVPTHANIAPHILERTSLWLLTIIINNILKNEPNLLNEFLKRVKPKLMELDDEQVDQPEVPNPYHQFVPQFQDTDDDDDDDKNSPNDILIPHELQRVVPTPVVPEVRPAVQVIDLPLLEKIKSSLGKLEYNSDTLLYIWKTIMIISSENAMNTTQQLIIALHTHVTSQLTSYPLAEASFQLQTLLTDSHSPTVQKSIEIFYEYLMHTQTKPLFYRLLLHPGVTEEQLENFLSPIRQLARELSHVEFVVFFDEVNTASCLGLFKEMFMDRTLHGHSLPKNIFFTAAINPSIKLSDDTIVHRQNYLVHQLPQALENLKVSYGALEPASLKEYIDKKIAKFRINSLNNSQKVMPLEEYAQEMLAESILNAQHFCEKYLGQNSVSQREIQRCFNLIEFFWYMRFDDEIENDDNLYQPNPIRCIALSLALIYYFRLPTEEDNAQRNDKQTPTREQLAKLLSQTIPDFVDVIQNELDRFVNSDNFVIPHAVAINQAVREHIFAIVVSIVTRTPLCIIGAPGQSKTLSFQIVLQNLQGSQLSIKPFCKRLPAIDPFFCLGSKYSRSEDIAYIFERALKREQQYEQNRMNTRCVVFLDEASLPDEKKMVLKVLHPYLDECKVAFVAIANKSFDAANANRMICIYRSLPSRDDQNILAYGCLGLKIKASGQQAVDNRLEAIINGLCQGYRRILDTPSVPHIYHDRDFIYMLRELRFELTTTTTDDQETRITGITPLSLLRALEDNFNGVKRDEFEKLVEIFFQAVQEQCPDFRLPPNRRNVPTILRESMKLDSQHRRLYGRYKLIIDESEDESAVRLISQNGIVDLDPNRTTVFRMSDFADDIHNELRNVEILSTIKLCMETGKTILMVNTGRIHGSLYDVFNQNFSIMATGDMRKIFSKVAIGPKTIDVVVHEDFQCIVHVKRSEFATIPAPFLSRFQKYSLSANDFYRIQFEQLSINEQTIMKNVEEKLQTFIQHFGRQYFYGLNENTLYSCLLSLIKKKENDQNYFLNTYQHYSQLTIRSKHFIEQNPSDIQLCVLRSVISKLIQLVSPESIILKLPTFEDKIARWLCTNYFHQQEHFHIENFVQQLISNPSMALQNDDLLTTMNTNVNTLNDIGIIRKVMIFTRTSSYIVGLNEQSNYELFGGLNDNEYNDKVENIDILNLTVIENSMELEEKFQVFEKHETKNVLIVIINARIIQQRLHIPYVRQLIDKTEYSCNALDRKQDKYFLMLVHSPPQEQYHQSSFPSIFLHSWDFYFFDSCAPGSAFHLQKMLQIVSSSFDQQQQESFDNALCDLNILFDDCLWDFCSRIQIGLQELPQDMFKNRFAFEFYKSQTSTLRRVQCLKQILQQSRQLQNHIVTIYHDHSSNKKESSKKIYNSIYQISKDIVCGKRFDGLVESIQSETRMSFTNFVSNVFKFIVNDYGLETLSTLSNMLNGYGSMLELIDYSSFAIDDNQDKLSPMQQGIFQLITHYTCIPQTPLYYLFHQRIKTSAESIKLKKILKQTEQKGKNDVPRQHYYSVPPITTADNNCDDSDDENEQTEYTFEQFRYELMKSILNDRVLTDIINENILNSYSNDLVRTFCTIVEKNFDDNFILCQKTIEFVSRWLLLVDDNDQQSLSECSNRHIWLLAHAYTSFEYDQNDLFSLYSACRIMDRLDSAQSCYDRLLHNNHITTRSEVRETLFRFMFDYLWKNLCEFCSKNDTNDEWIHIYTFISKYYPSDKVLQRTQLIEIKEQIEFMNLAYLILINDTTPEPKNLISSLLNDIHIVHINNNNNIFRNQSKSAYLKLLPTIIDYIQSYLENRNAQNSTLMIDLQQWIVSMLKSCTESCKEEIGNLFIGLNKSSYRLSLPMKQLLFDKLANLYLEYVRQNRPTTDAWDRLKTLLPLTIESLDDENVFNEYQLPYHPSIITDDNNQRQPLIDLFFFYVQRYFHDETIKCNFVNKIMQANLPNTKIKYPKLATEIFKKLKDYFLVRLTALLLCQTDVSPDDQRIISRITMAIINGYLLIDRTAIQLTQHLQIFLSTIISKRSWSYLFNLLKSDHIQRLNSQWANTLCGLLEMTKTTENNKYIQLCHKIHFTLSSNNASSMFPKLHQAYEQLKGIVRECAKENVVEERWKKLSDWVQLQQNMNPPMLDLKEIKIMLLLNIYYDYYCNNQLESLNTLIVFIESTLEPSPEELLVFRVMLQPEHFMIGYPRRNENIENNFLNNLFKLDCQHEDELCIRHSLVNLIAMIFMGGKQSFLWTFAFNPLKLQNTFGFGSTAHQIIQSNGVHYDCGCIITQNGDLMQFERAHASALNVPAVYVAYLNIFVIFCCLCHF